MITKQRLPECICGQIEYEVVYKGEWVDREGKLSFSIIRCLNCDLLRTFPVPKKTTATFDDVKLRVENYGLWRSFAQYLIDFIKKHQKRKTVRLLDIGSNIGILVKLAEENGWQGIGIDLDKRAIDVGRRRLGINLRHASLENAHFGSQEFDVVVLSHILEHVVRPCEFLKEAKDVLKKDGLLIVQLPNIEGLPVKLQKIRKEVWYGYWPTQHIWHFTPKTIRRLLEDEGFKILELHARRPMHYEKTGSWLDIPRDLILKLSGFLNMADQITLAAAPQK